MTAVDDVYLDAATAFKDTECADNPGSDPTEQWMLDYAHRISERPAFRAAVNVAQTRTRAEVAEEIARAIEVYRGERCPECGGKPASLRWVQFKRHGRCGGGHTWVADHAKGQWRSVAEIARAHAVEPAAGEVVPL